MKYFQIIIFLFLTNILFAQTFPTTWIGNYEGDLEIYGVDSTSMVIKMNLDIDSTSTDSIFLWQISYQIDTVSDIRKYELHVLDRAKGLYQIDEKNSIIIESYLNNNNIFTSYFSVMNNFIIATYTKVDDYIEFEIIMAKTDAVSSTGETEQEGEEIPKVESYFVKNRQKAILYRLDGTKG